MALDVHVSIILIIDQNLSIIDDGVEFAAAYLCPAPFGQHSRCHNCLLERNQIGMFPTSLVRKEVCSDISVPVTRIFSEKEILIARSRMPSERKFLTGLFKWEDIKRWHTTWPVYLCELFKS